MIMMEIINGLCHLSFNKTITFIEDGKKFNHILTLKHKDLESFLLSRKDYMYSVKFETTQAKLREKQLNKLGFYKMDTIYENEFTCKYTFGR